MPSFVQLWVLNDEVGCVGETEEEVHTIWRKVVIVLKVFGKTFPNLGIIIYLCNHSKMIHTMATRNENPAPFMAVHPGMMIKPELEERGITQKDFAKMLGVQASHLSEVLNCKRALTTDLAVKIEGAIGLPAKILLSAQTQYELETTNSPIDDKEQETFSVTIPIRDRNLLRELVRKFGWACVF